MDTSAYHHHVGEKGELEEEPGRQLEPQVPGIFNKREQGQSKAFCCLCSEKYTWQTPGRRVSWRTARNITREPKMGPRGHNLGLSRKDQ